MTTRKPRIPKRPGYYWMSPEPGMEWELVSVYRGGSMLCRGLMWFGNQFEKPWPLAEFEGPLKPPTRRKKGKK